MCGEDIVAQEEYENKGRGLKAIKDIDRGVLIYEEEPYAAVTYSNVVNDVCANCFADRNNVFLNAVKKISILRCSRCKKISYCSVECQKHDWKVHKIECRWLQNTIGLPSEVVRIVGRCIIRDKQKPRNGWKTSSLYVANPDLFNEEIQQSLFLDSMAAVEYIPRVYGGINK